MSLRDSMSKSIILKQYQRALAKWPADTLRPDVPFAKTIQKRIEERLAAENGALDLAKEKAQANALFTLLENRYSNKYPLSRQILEPRSKPMYYKNLLKEFEEAPKRSWIERQLNKWKGFLRFK